MASQLAPYNFPDVYSDLVNNFVGTVKYVATTGSDSNNGNSVTTPYLTIDYAYSQTSATANVMIVVLQGTYTMTAVTASNSNSTALRDGGNKRVFVCCPGRTIIQWTANTADRDCSMAQFTNSGSAVYGAILKRNNNARTTSYTVSFFRSYDGALKGNFYNCVFSETNGNNAWSYQYDNYGAANFGIRNCTFYNGAAPVGNYSNAGTCLTIDSVFNTTCTTGGTETNVLKSQTVNATTYVTTGVTTAGVYSGTYSWSAAITYPAANVASVTNGTSYVSPDGLYTYYKFLSSGSITLNNSANTMGIEVLVVAGGGGGSGNYGGNAVPAGGGGAGAVVYHSNYVVSNGTYAITVGGGGTAGSAVNGTNGNDSIFGSNLVVAKGGGGAGWYAAGNNGGCGGGGGYNGTLGGTSTQAGSGVNPSGSVYYGTIGGQGATISSGSGGGGGAAAKGVDNAGVANGQAGGPGTNTYSTLLTTTSAGVTVSGLNYVAGGGGGGGSYSAGGTGGSGGAGGGGRGGDTTNGNAVAGTTNTGGGGGGSPNTYLGGTGGSGLVILKVYTGVPSTPGLYGPNSVSSGSQIPLTLVTSGLADSTLVPYTITGVTSAQLNGGSLSGNLTIVANSSSISINTFSFVSSANLVFSANSYTKNVLISFPATITTEMVPVTIANTETLIIRDVPGSMNVPEIVVTVLQYDLTGNSLYDIAGQMNILDSVVSVNNVTLSSNIEPLQFSSRLSNTVVPYTTITNSFAGAIDTPIIKVFGEIAQREYWM